MIFLFKLCLFFLFVLYFFNLVDDIVLTSIVVFSSCFSTYFFLRFLFYFIKRELEVKNADKIDKDDKEKFNYYREILKNYSISELGYLFNHKSDVDLLIAAELEALKKEGNIKINNQEIEILKSDNLNPTANYLLSHYKFLNDYKFKKEYLKCIEKSLENKNCMQIHNYKKPKKRIVYNGIMLSYSIKRYVKTDIGKEIYLKLLGLKNFLNDFGSFEEKTLREIILWEEYILYAIILKESRNLTKELKEEFNNLVDVIYNKNNVKR